jgi:hypothetical protein
MKVKELIKRLKAYEDFEVCIEERQCEVVINDISIYSSPKTIILER